MSEILLTNGTILTMKGPTPRAQAAVIRGNTIAGVGSDAEMKNVASSDAVVVDLDGRTLVPGFNDCHIHLTGVGQQELMVNLTGLTKTEIVEALKEREKTLPSGELLMGSNWDYSTCPDPHKDDLDAAFPDRPVLLLQFSGHGGWANSAGLAFMKIDETTKEWDIGGPDRDEQGELTGIVREPGGCPSIRSYWFKQAMNRKLIRDALPIAMATLSSHGITSVQDNTWWPAILSELAALNRAGKQTVRVSCWTFGALPPLEFWLAHRRFKPDWYVRGARKHFIDGAFSSRTAWLSEPYADSPDITGSGKDSRAIERWLRKATRSGRQMACHSIGDAATTAYLDAMEQLHRRSGSAERAMRLRHRIEHGQLVAQGDIERIVRLGVVVSAQPHAATDPEKDERLLGPERTRRAYAYRDLLDAGAALAFGSDYPGENTFDPLYGIHLAVNREGGQAITAEEAISCYTAGSAYAEFAEDRKGMIDVGHLADMAILSADPTTVDPATIRDIRVDATVMDGRFVYRRAGVNVGELAEESASPAPRP